MDSEEPTQNLEFPQLVKRNFKFLVSEFGFSISSEHYTGITYGEWIITFSSSDLFVNIILDKAQVSVNIGVPHNINESVDLIFAMMFMTNSDDWKYLTPGGMINSEYYDKQLKHVSTILFENFEKISRLVFEITNSRKARKRYIKFVNEYFKRFRL